ncbi:MAG: hypothetical protein KBT46_04345, partial [Ruminococcus sp.]|nr:hypothetical protein [Candidatus Copronaster equi]
TINETPDTTGKLAAKDEQIFTLPDGVKVLSVVVEEGDNVGEGQTIASFDTQSLQDFVDRKEEDYELAQSAYKEAVRISQKADGNVGNIREQIEELEEKIAEYKAQTGSNYKAMSKSDDSDKEETTTTKTTEGVSVSDSLVKRFIRVANLLGIDYSEDEARRILVNFLSSGSSISDLTTLMDQMSAASTMKNFDMSKFSLDMTELASLSPAGTQAIEAELTLAQLKAQLAAYEIQSNDKYLDTYKLVAQKAKEAYSQAQDEYEKLKDGWKCNSAGIVCEVNIKDGATSKSVKDSQTGSSVDINTILSALSSGSDATSMISSFFGSRPTAIRILNYPLVANISLNKYDINDVKLNQRATVKSANGEVFDGKVSYISPTATSSSSIDISSMMGSGSSGSTIPAQVTIQSESRSLIVGVDIDVSIITDTVQNAIVVPVEAICIDGSDMFVYTYDKARSRAVKKPVTLGISNDTYYQVTSGVEPGDVLIKNTSKLDDNVKVKLKEAK